MQKKDMSDTLLIGNDYGIYVHAVRRLYATFGFQGLTIGRT